MSERVFPAQMGRVSKVLHTAQKDTALVPVSYELVPCTALL